MMGVHEIYCDNNFMMCQIFMLYTLKMNRIYILFASLVAHMVKINLCNAGDLCSIPR